MSHISYAYMPNESVFYKDTGKKIKNKKGELDIGEKWIFVYLRSEILIYQLLSCNARRTTPLWLLNK